jgi:hypothetical protein
MNETFRIIIIFIILCITSYIILRLYLNRLELQKMNRVREGLSDWISSEKGETNSNVAFFNKIPMGITDVSPQYYGLQLQEFCIKGSYNSAMTGSYVSGEMIETVLNRGCRFIDLNVAFIMGDDNKGTACVISTSENNLTSKNSGNSIKLNDAVTSINKIAFSTAPNKKDPLFIQLRILPSGSANKDEEFFKQIKTAMDRFQDHLYKGPVNGSTTLTNLIGKVVIITDWYTLPDFKDTELREIVNIVSGTTSLIETTYFDLVSQATTPVTVKNDLTTNVQSFQLIYPDKNYKSNPDIYYYVQNYGVQLAPNRFYIHDNNLKIYEEFFNTERSAFVPLSVAIKYMSKVNNLPDPNGYYLPTVYTGQNDPLSSIYNVMVDTKSDSHSSDAFYKYGTAVGTISVIVLIYLIKFT